eukprot:3386230-Prymnesium_polylepis.1
MLPGASAGGGACEHRRIDCQRSGFTAEFYSGTRNPQDAEVVSSKLLELVIAKMDCIAELEGEGAGGQGCKQRCDKAYLSGCVAGLPYGA